MLKIAGIGELLWDVSEDSRNPGGAPMNFAYHASQLGCEAYPITCVGTDSDGQALQLYLEAKGICCDYVFQTPQAQTGIVDVSFANGKPNYRIREHAAWDHIPFIPQLKKLCTSLDALCFGTLASRCPVSQETIKHCIEATPAKALRVFDVNFRESFFSKALVEEYLRLANILKLSDEELPWLIQEFGLSQNPETALNEILEAYSLDTVLLTMGATGAHLLSRNHSIFGKASPAKAVDTIGCGDAFTAASVFSILNRETPKTVLEFANKIAGYVSTQPGGMPTIPGEILES
ncbi:MAG: carbohydrate kinase [Verrucomicrobiota bacterium]